MDANPNISRSRYSTGNENTEDYDAALATPKRADETTRVETSADSASLIHRSTSSNIYDANAEQTSSVNGDTSCSEKSLWTPPPLSSSANIARQFSGFPRTPLDQVVGPYKNITDRKTSRKKKMQSFGRGEDLVSSYGHFEFLAAGGSKMVYQHDGNVLVIMYVLPIIHHRCLCLE